VPLTPPDGLPRPAASPPDGLSGPASGLSGLPGQAGGVPGPLGPPDGPPGPTPGVPGPARRALRIVVADDAVLLREGLVRLLAEDGHQVVAAVGDGPALVEAVLRHHPDVSVVDVRMPPTHTDEGLRAAITARSRLPGAPMLVLSQYVEASYASDLLADGSGAVGYLLKDRVARVGEFLDALGRVARGATVLDPQVIAQLLAGQRRDNALAALTARERQLLALMAEGHSNTAIAQRLVISASAVEKHISNVFAKLGLPPDDAQHRRVLAVLAYLGT
jgi:DNA-binding NarL/FixJ family response regulator